jgi:hypothetical protein
MWSVKMPDSVLAIQSTEDCTVFAALADGFVAVLQNVSSEAPDSDPLLVRIGSGAVPCLALDSMQQLWCGCGNAITILSSQSFEPIHSIAFVELTGKVYKMVASQLGVWVSFRSSSVVSLYEARLHVKLLQVDYTSLLPPNLSFSDKLDSRITSLMVADSRLWVGTGKGMVLIFSVSAVPETEAAIAQLAQDTRELAVLVEDGGSSSSTAGHGLVTAALAGGSQEAATTEPTARRGKSHYVNRRTVFGRTLRGHSRKPVERSPAVFQLHYGSSYQLVQAESVRVLLSLCQGSAAVSCIHSAADWAKGVQGWTCHGTPDKWTFQHLQLSPDQLQDPNPNELTSDSSAVSGEQHVPCASGRSTGTKDGEEGKED